MLKTFWALGSTLMIVEKCCLTVKKKDQDLMSGIKGKSLVLPLSPLLLWA